MTATFIVFMLALSGLTCFALGYLYQLRKHYKFVAALGGIINSINSAAIPDPKKKYDDLAKLAWLMINYENEEHSGINPRRLSVVVEDAVDSGFTKVEVD